MTAQPRVPDSCPPDVRHIARQSLAEAIALLKHRPLSDRSVHAVRKDLKRARAMLRLMRAALGEEAYRRDNAALRDVARTLGAARDSKVLLDTLQSVPKSRRDSSAGQSRSELSAQLRREHARSRGRLRDDGTEARNSCQSLRTVRRRLTRVPTERYGWPVLQAGVRRVYKRARATFRRAQARRAAQDLHELRKQTKYLWHQLEALANSHARQTGALAAATHRLSDLLGDDHNLTVLRAKVLHTHVPTGARERLLARIDARRDRLVGQALSLAQRIYRDAPAEFTARIAGRRARRRRGNQRR